MLRSRRVVLLGIIAVAACSSSDPVDASGVDAAGPRDAGADASDARPFDGGGEGTRVVVVGIDGLGGDWVTPELAPAISALGARGTRTNAMQDALPSSSSTNWMSMICGAHPEQHGVLSNLWLPGMSTPPPTIFAALRTARPGARIGIFHEWTGFGRLVEPGVADVITAPGDATETMDAAIAFVRESLFDLLFVHLDLVDHAGHDHGWGSPEYEAALLEADGHVARLIAAIDEEGLGASTAIVVSADHGGVATGHGDDTRAERSIPFVVAGPGVSVSEITREVRIWDIAPTVLRLLEIEAPAAWIASPIVEAFGGLPDDAPAEPLELVAVSAYTLGYDESGTGATETVSIWHPTAASGNASLGDVALSGHAMPTASAWTTPASAPGVRAPVAYEMIWNDRGSGGARDGSLWSPIPPLGYVCLGDVAVAGYDAPPLDAVRCVHRSYVVSSPAVRTWSDAGSGATLDGSVWACASSPETALGTFYARRHGAGDAGTNRCHALLTSRVVVR